MKIKMPSQKKMVVWILIYVLFIAHGTNIFNFAHMTVALPLTILVVFFFFSYECKLEINLLIAFAALLFNYIVTGILTSSGLLEGFNFTGWMEMLFVTLAVILLYKIDDDPMTKFLKIVYFFSIISLICYALVMFNAGSVLTSLFSTYDAGMGPVAGKFFYVYNLRSPERNASVFTEPGIFQAVLIMCIYTILFQKSRISLSDKVASKYLIVYLIAIITTKSAAGYVGLLAVVIAMLFKRKNKRDIGLVVVLAIGVIFLIYNYYSQGDNSILQEYFFDKFLETQNRDITKSSGGARLVAMVAGIEAATQHPFGIGYMKWEYQLFQIYGTKFGTGNALFTQLGTRGFIAFFGSLWLGIYPAYKRRDSWVSFILFVFLFIYISCVQAKILYPAIVLVAYLPCKLKRNEK